MDLIGWSLNAIDQIFSTRKMGEGEPACPDGTFAAGYTMDSWKKWNTVCLSILSVEDVEDVYIIGIMVLGFLLFGAGGFLFYRKGKKAIAAYSALRRLPVNFDTLGRAVNTQTQAMCEQNRGLNRKVDLIMEKLNNV